MTMKSLKGFLGDFFSTTKVLEGVMDKRGDTLWKDWETMYGLELQIQYIQFLALIHRKKWQTWFLGNCGG